MRRFLIVFFAFGILLVLGFAYVFRAADVNTAPIILGHGGSGSQSTLPLNSLVSVENALSNDIGGVEIDVRLSSDNELIAIHDEELSRNTTCSGKVEFTSSSELTNCKHKTWLRKASVQTAREILNSVNPKRKTISLDVKPNQNIATLTSKLIELVQQYNKTSFIIESRDKKLLSELRRKETKALLFLNISTLPEINSATELQLDGVVVNLKHANEELIKRTSEANLQLMLWNTGSVFSNRKAIELQPDYIQTDAIWSMKQILH